MLSNALHITRQALRQPGVWTVLVWDVGLWVFTLLAIFVAGAGAILPAFLPHVTYTANPTISPSVLNPILRNLIGVFLLILIVGAFWAAGTYGLFGLAVKNEQVSWNTFWVMGRRLYGRAWGFGLYVFLYSLILIVLGAVLVLLLHVVGGILAALALFLSFPWVLRMAGGLFVDQLTWGQSFSASFHGKHFGGLLLGLVLAGIVSGVMSLLQLALVHAMGAVGFMIYMIISLVAYVAVPIWAFALYVSSQNPS